MAGVANFGGKKAAPFKKGGGRQKMTKAQDTAYDKKHGIKEGSPEDKKLDAERGVKDTASGLRAQAKKMVKASYKGSKKDSDTRKLPPKQSKKERKAESLNFSNVDLAKKVARGDFALPGGRFPLNTPGRIKAAPGLASRSAAVGNISPAQAAKVRAAAKRALRRLKK